MTEARNSKQYDLEDRTKLFAKSVALFCRKLQKNIIVIEYIKQVIRSSASIGANYIEANESLSKKDFLMRVKICRKEAKETVFWLELIGNIEDSRGDEIGVLLGEAIELKKIFSSIIEKSK